MGKSFEAKIHCAPGWISLFPRLFWNLLCCSVSSMTALLSQLPWCWDDRWVLTCLASDIWPLETNSKPKRKVLSKGSEVLVTVPLLWKDTLVKATYKRKHVIGSLLQFHRVSSWSSWQRPHGRERGSREAGVMLEQWLRACVYKQREKLSLRDHLQWHTSSTRTTPSNLS